MNKLYLGLAIAVIIGLAVALFPLYSDRFADFLWTKRYTTEESGRGPASTEEYIQVTGVITKVDTDCMAITVNGQEIVIRGTWKIITPDGKEEEVEAADLLAMLKPGMQIKAKVIEKGRWIKAEELDFDGYHAVKVTG